MIKFNVASSYYEQIIDLFTILLILSKWKHILNSYIGEEEEMICPNCHQDVKNGNFCEKCGAPISKLEDLNKVICPKCSKKVQNEKFCESCGFLLQPEEDKTVSKSILPMDKPENCEEVIQHKQSLSQKKKRIIWPWVVGILSLLLIGGIAFWYLYLNKNDDKKLFEVKNDSASNSVEENEISLQVGQVDTSAYPTIKLYLSAKENEDEALQQLEVKDLVLKERYRDSYKEVSVKSIEKFSEKENLNMNFVIDTSGSMEENGLLNSCKDIARKILETIDYSKSQAGIISFNTEATLTSYLTNNYDSINNALSALTPDGETALYDALMMALDETDKNSGAKLIIAFTDGIDNSSKSTPDEVIQKSRELGIPIYVVGLLNEEDIEGTAAIEKICTDTNGNYIAIDDIQDLERLYKELLSEAEKQYVITYESTISDGENTNHEIQLGVAKDKKNGYIETTFEVQPKDNRLDVPKFIKQKEFAQSLADKYLKPISGSNSLYFGNVEMGSPLTINDTPLRSASTIKLFIMIEVMQQIEDGMLYNDMKLTMSESDKVGGTGVIQNQESGSAYTIQQLLEYMMIDSDNTAANMLVDAVGGVQVVNSRIKALGCVNSQMNRKMLDTEALKQGKDNYVTVYDMGNILTRIYNKQCVSDEADTYMLQLMSKNTNHKKIPGALPRNVTVYNKTGEYDEYGVQNDVAIVETDKGTYVLCVLTQDGKANEEINAIKNLSKELYDECVK